MPHEVRSSSYVVRAERASDAEQVARLLDRLIPAVREAAGADADVVTVRIASGTVPTHAAGQTLRDGVIVIDPRASAYSESLVAHELAHHYFDADEVWAAMPQVLEEGLADVVAGHALPERAFGIQVRHASHLPPWGSVESGRSALRAVLSADSYADEFDRALGLRAIGFVLARRLGRNGVLDLCREARRREYDEIPADWILAACGVGAEVEVGLWSRVLREADPDGWSSFPIERAARPAGRAAGNAR